MCLCVRLQNSREKPRKDDPKYIDEARALLLAKQVQNGQAITMRILRKATQQCYRKAYNTWYKSQSRERDRERDREREDERDAAVLAELGFWASYQPYQPDDDDASSPPPVVSSLPVPSSPVPSSPPAALPRLQARSPAAVCSPMSFVSAVLA